MPGCETHHLLDFMLIRLDKHLQCFAESLTHGEYSVNLVSVLSVFLYFVYYDVLTS